MRGIRDRIDLRKEYSSIELSNYQKFIERAFFADKKDENKSYRGKIDTGESMEMDDRRRRRGMVLKQGTGRVRAGGNSGF